MTCIDVPDARNDIWSRKIVIMLPQISEFSPPSELRVHEIFDVLVVDQPVKMYSSMQDIPCLTCFGDVPSR